MGKKKGRRNPRPRPVEQPASSDDERYNDVDPKSGKYFYDDIDDFHKDRDKILLDSSKRFERKQNDDSSEEEEVFSLGSAAEDSDDEGQPEQDEEQDSEEYENEDMSSDLEDKNEKGLPDDKAWGKKKSMYYNTDYVDKDYGGEFDGSDAELAEEEEKEAKALQQRLLQNLDEIDFDLDSFKVAQKISKPEEEIEIQKDLSKLSKQEKLQLLNRESPELLSVIDDLKEKLSIEKQDLLPLLQGIKGIDRDNFENKLGVNYLEIKHQLILNYCANVCFYLMLKAKRVPIINHPVMKRLLLYRNLFKELQPLDTKLKDQMDELLSRLNQKENITSLIEGAGNFSKLNKKKESVKKNRLRIATKINSRAAEEIQEEEEEKTENVPQKKKKNPTSLNRETDDEKNALELYNLMKSKQDSNKRRTKVEDYYDDDSDADMDDNDEGDEDMDQTLNLEDEQDEDDDGTTDKRRKINYQIAKNKGLTPYRKKEFRNPRVRNREKFRRAKIRRLGQVRAPRKELSKYGGEMSGIKASVSRSIKLK